MTIEVTKRVNNISPSATLVLSSKAKAMQAKGIDVVNLSIGQPDFNTPEHIKAGAIKAIKEGKSDFYTAAVGIQPLRQAIADQISNDYEIHVDADQIAVTTGGKFGLYAVTQSLVNPGDEVLIPLPYWVSYGEQVKLAGGKPIFVKPQAGLKITVEDLEAKRTEKTKVLIMNTPQNPSGIIYSKDELTEIGNWAVKNNIVILTDDMYGKLIYNGHHFISLWQLSDGIRQQSILVNGMSKTYAMTGWRVGYVSGPKEFIKKLTGFLGHATGNISAVSQYAALAAVTGPQDCVEMMRNEYEKRLNTIYPLWSEIPGFKVQKPEGAFYLFPNVAEAVKNCGFASTDDFCDALLNEAHVAVVPGTAFGMDTNFRISYATSMENLLEATKRIKKFVLDHQK